MLKKYLINKPLIKTSCVLLLAAGIHPQPLFADEQFAGENLQQLNEYKTRHLLSDHSAHMAMIKEQQKVKLQQLTAKNPTEKRVANIFFKQGVSAKALKILLAGKSSNEKGLVLLSVQGKAELPQSQTTLSVSFSDLNAFADIEEGLKYYQDMHEREATALKKRNRKNMTKGEIEVMQDMFATRKQLLYVEAKVFGANQSLLELSNNAELVELVAPDTVMPAHTFTISEDELSNLIPPSIDESTEDNSFNGEFLEPNVQPSASNLCGPTAGVVDELNCPPDKFWVPSPKMASGAKNSVISYITNYTYYGHRWTTGSFYSRFNWSTHPDNTAAFKNTSLPHCDPDIDYDKLTARCDSDDNNVIYVPDSTYEDEGRIPNPACSLILRTGTNYDRRAGCFMPSYVVSNLPTYYTDTTISDGRDYNGTVGSFNAKNIVPGKTYYHFQKFWAWGNNILSEDDTLAHSGQIGSKFCSLSPAFCTFAVDTTNVHENLEYKPVNSY